MKEQAKKWRVEVEYIDWDPTVSDTQARNAMLGLVGDSLLCGTGQILRYVGGGVALIGIGACAIGTELLDKGLSGWNNHYTTLETWTNQKKK